MTIAFVSHPACRRHEISTAHPESPARLFAIDDELLASGLELVLRHFDSPAASYEQLLRVHDSSYIDRVFSLAPKEGSVWLDSDTAMNPYSLEAALHAAGSAVLAVDLVLAGNATSVFCSVRPPGHHAGRARAMGFCIFNNVAIGAAHALDHYGLERVAILDFDVHHGNGTEDIFRDNPRVLFCSTFQHPFYPFSDTRGQDGRLVKTPLAAGADSHTFRDAIREHWLDTISAFDPELIFVSAGFDAHHQDDMAELNLTEHDYAWVTHKIKQAADTHANGRIISLLEGGYALQALGRSVVAHLNALLG